MAVEYDQKKDMQAHAGTYDFFKKLMKRGTILAGIAAVFVVWLIAH